MASLPNRLIQCPGACFANCGSGLSVCQQCRARERGFASPSQSAAHNMMCAICSKGGAGWGVCFTGAAAAWVVASAAARSQGRSWRPASRARPPRRRRRSAARQAQKAAQSVVLTTRTPRCFPTEARAKAMFAVSNAQKKRRLNFALCIQKKRLYIVFRRCGPQGMSIHSGPRLCST